jgi:Icc-related predicted phosphoesterase
MARIFFAVDVHGATSVWKKWIKVLDLYQIDVLMLCGDLTGKALVPIVQQGDGTYKSFYFGQEWLITTTAELKEFEGRLADAGVYSLICSKEELEELKQNPKLVDEIFDEKIRSRLENWLSMLAQEISLTKRIAVVMPGNDDKPEIVDPLIKSFEDKGIIYPLDKVVEIEGMEIVSFEYVNPSPFRTYRELSEKTLEEKVEQLINRLKNPDYSIFNFHCPPHGTKLDLAPELDKNKKPIIIAGQMSFQHVGSRALRKIVEKYQPPLYLHGHIHESAGIDYIGKTLIINPGSEYSEGILKGYIIEIKDKKLISYHRIEG